MKAYVIYGPSGSGKSIKAEELLDQIDGYFHHVERDEIRDYIYPDFSKVGWKGGFHPDLEDYVTYEWYVEINRASVVGRDLIISDTNCKIRDRRKLKRLLEYLDYEIEWMRMDTTLEECIERDSKRGIWTVGEDVIRSQWEHFIKNQEHV